MAAGGYRGTLQGMVVATCLGAVLAACGSGEGSSPPDSTVPAALARVRASATRTVAAKSAHIVTTTHLLLTGSATGPPTSQSVVITGDVDFTDDRASVLITSTGGSTSTTDTGAGMATQVAAQEVYIGRQYYERLIEENVPSTRWEKGTAANSYAYLGLFTTEALAHLRGHAREVGTDVINGVPTAHYEVAVPGSTETRSARGSAPSQLITIKPYVLGVWLDHEGRIVQMQGTRNVTLRPSTGKATTETSASQVNLSRFGEPVHITAPVGARALKGG